MEMPRFWDDRVNWYGPAGVGQPVEFLVFEIGIRYPLLMQCRIVANM